MIVNVFMYGECTNKYKMSIYQISSSQIVRCLFILLSIFFVRCSGGMEVLMQPDRSYVAFLNGDFGSADLSNLELSSGELTPEFGSNTTSYTSVIDISVNAITVTPTAAEKNAILLVNGVPAVSGQPTALIAMAHGENPITVDVTSYDLLLTKTYYINVLRCDLNNADLTSLALSSGTLDTAFSTDDYSYTAYVDISEPSITLTPTAEEPYASIRVNGTLVPSGGPSPDIPINPGDNTITVDVLSYDGSVSRTYSVTVIKCEPGNADLSNLVLSTGTLSPVFAFGTLGYITNIHTTVSSITLTPTADDPYATITVEGSPIASGQPSGSILLVDGVNPALYVVVTSPDGSITKTYTVTVTRLDMYSTNLSSLLVADQSSSNVPYAPAFSEGQTSYTSTVDIGVTSVTVTPTAVSGGSATITVNGAGVPSGTASGPIALVHGDNVITVYVTNGAFTPQTYTMTITRLDWDNANLSGIALSNGSLSPAFSAVGEEYTASVTEGSITVTPTAEEPDATIAVHTDMIDYTVVSGQPSGSIPMSIGDNTITITVTSPDELTSKTYTIIANRSTILPADFVSTRSIRLDTTSSGADVNSTVTNFPVLIRLTDSTIIDGVRSDADDIRFRTNGGTVWLSYEIERWDQTNNVAEVWVLVPSIAGNSNTYITMYYNDVVNDAIPSGQNAAAVFSTSNGFAGVWHMNENPAGGAGVIRDRTTNANHGTSAGSMTASDSVDGQIGKCIDFDGSNDEINLGTGASLQPHSLTASFWVKKPSSLFGFFIYRNFLGMKSSKTGNGWYIDFSPGLVTGIGAVPLEFYVNGNNNGWVLTPELVDLDWLTLSEWVHITVTFDDDTDTCNIYTNGVQENNLIEGIVGNPTTISTTTGSKYIGGGDFNSTLNGKMDEVRISSVARSADWVRLEYENQKADQSLVKFP